MATNASASPTPAPTAGPRTAVNGGPAVIALALFALALITEYRFRVEVSASIPEVFAYLAILAVLYESDNSPAQRTSNHLWVFFGLLTLMLAARAFYFKVGRQADVESAFSHARDDLVPLFIAVLVYGRLRLGVRGQRIVGGTFIFMGAVAGATGICQFFTGGPYLFDGIDIIAYKTAVAQKYWIAEVLHLEVKNLARGFYGFSLAYASALVPSAVLAFALAWTGPRRQRILAGIAFALIYAGIYLSFSRSIVAIVPFGCFLAVRGIQGKLSPLTCVAAVAGYIGVAFVAPALHLTHVDDSDLGTLNSRQATVAAYFTHVARDPTVLLYGTHIGFWREWNSLSPHNWVICSLLVEGIPATLLRLGLYCALFVVLWPVRRGRPSSPYRCGLWAGGFTLLCIVGETEPFAGITEYLVAGFTLALLAAARPEDDDAWLPTPKAFTVINGSKAD